MCTCIDNEIKEIRIVRRVRMFTRVCSIRMLSIYRKRAIVHWQEGTVLLLWLSPSPSLL